MSANNWWVSPRFDMNALREGVAQPLDVFEDAINGWFFKYASKLVDLNEADAGMAVMNLIAAYPETIECYSAGKESKGRSKEFFTQGMKRIFPELVDTVPANVLESICDDLRNGLYHTSMLKNSVVFLVPTGAAVKYVTAEQLSVNPFEFFRRVREHFTAYVAELRADPSGDAKENFTRYWNARHGIPAQRESVVPCAGPPMETIVTSTAAPTDLQKFVRLM